MAPAPTTQSFCLIQPGDFDDNTSSTIVYVPNSVLEPIARYSILCEEKQPERKQ